ncbi:MAG: phosphotransferase [Halanaerobium sp.]|nr:phosphotransferase [Halanaerobium sp.]
MDMKTREAFNEQVLDEAIARFGISSDMINFLGGFQNFVYQFTREGQDFILRFSHDSRRTPELVMGEVDWLNYLARNGLKVCKAVKSKRDRIVEVIDAGQTSFSAVSFVKAPGRPTEQEDLTEELFIKMGNFIGRMHMLTRDYEPSTPEIRRPEWYEGMDSLANSYLNEVDDKIKDKFIKIRRYPEKYTMGRDEYGLIHCDFHRHNFHLYQNEIYLYDFDECSYSWFVEDIAMALFYALPDEDLPDFKQKAQQIYDWLMTGYLQENNLNPVWLNEIPYFLKQREINIYIVLKASKIESPFLARHRDKIINDIPFVDIKFT